MKRNMKKTASSRSTTLRLETLENRALLSAVGLTSPEPLVISDVASEFAAVSSARNDVVAVPDLSKAGGAEDVVDAKGGDLVFNGTDAADAIHISTETQTVTTPVFTENPYAKTLERYEAIYGKNSKVYQQIEANLNKAFERLSKVVVTKTSTVGVVDINGDVTKFTGAHSVTINAGAGDDAVKIDALHYDYMIKTKGENNALDFFGAEGRLNLDLGNTHRQCAIIGDGGTLKLSGAFTTVDGTEFNDRIVGTDAGLTFFGNGGSDSVTLVGGQNNVFAFGPRQSIIARGTGQYNVEIWDAEYSVVNADGVKKTGETNVKADNSPHLTVFGGRGYLSSEIEGKYATVNAAATNGSDTRIEGKHAVVTTGAGVDNIWIEGDSATVTTGASADYVSIFGSLATVHLGEGADICLLRDGVNGKLGGNHVWGDGGDDVIVSAWSEGVNYLYGGAGNDFILGGLGNDYIYGNAGDNIMAGLSGADHIYGGPGRDAIASSIPDGLDLTDIDTFFAQARQAWLVDKDVDAMVNLLGQHCIADGAKDWVYRGSGRGNLIYASKIDGDFENALERSPFQDELILD